MLEIDRENKALFPLPSPFLTSVTSVTSRTLLVAELPSCQSSENILQNFAGMSPSCHAHHRYQKAQTQ